MRLGKRIYPSGIRELFELTISLGGTISGEHGIGLVQKNTWTSLLVKPT